MKPTDILKAEHRVIEQILNALEKISQEGLREHKLNGDSARLALEFFRGFADQCHHGKEEVHLFPMMESKGFSRDNGPTGVMIHEHEQGRQFIREMDKSIPGAERGDAEALKAFASNATGYIGMLREHIQKEDHCLFSMADNAMNAEDQERLSEQFEKVEAEEMGEGTHEKFIGIAQTLMKRHGLETEIPEGAKSCCHHH